VHYLETLHRDGADEIFVIPCGTSTPLPAMTGQGGFAGCAGMQVLFFKGYNAARTTSMKQETGIGPGQEKAIPLS
jgi:hypothetical protein